MFVLPTFNLGVVGSPAESIEFPVIEVYDTEAEFIDQTDSPQYTIVAAKDTDRLYVWDGAEWILYNKNSLA
jgi:hypothetical protein